MNAFTEEVFAFLHVKYSFCVRLFVVCIWGKCLSHSLTYVCSLLVRDLFDVMTLSSLSLDCT